MFLFHLCWCFFLFPGLETSILTANCFLPVFPQILCHCILSIWLPFLPEDPEKMIILSLHLCSSFVFFPSLSCAVLHVGWQRFSTVFLSLRIGSPQLLSLLYSKHMFLKSYFWCSLLLLLFWTFRLGILNPLKQFQFKLWLVYS